MKFFPRPTQVLLLLAMVFLNLASSCNRQRPETRVLVFTKTLGYRHPSITNGIEAIQKLGKKYNVLVDTTENAARFNEENLKRYSAVIFLNTTGDVLNHIQQADFERYIQAGGGYVGVHAASDTEYKWPWYNHLAGAYFESHPAIQEAKLHVRETNHPATEGLPNPWVRKDEWYDFKPGSLDSTLKILLDLDESSYQGGKMNGKHPIAWYHEYDGGRAFYTALGHTEESYTEPLFLKHLLGGIRYAIGENLELDYSKARTPRVPETSRFSRTVLSEVFFEPMAMEVFPNGDVVLIERSGALKKYDAQTQSTRVLDSLKVNYKLEDGLLGFVRDPNYTENHWIYLFYSPPGDSSAQRVSRFVLKDDKLDKTSEKVVIEIPVQRKECCHSAGYLNFDDAGNLFISVGDNTNPFFSDGYAPIDGQPGRSAFDARHTSSNTNDLRGKILRIKPESDGSYSIPEGNLFPKGTAGTRPEIYVMGCRNPYRHAWDPKRKYLYWGDVGPDAVRDSTGRGPRGHDEVNQAKKAGYFGWPLFNANNKPYNAYDFATKTSGEPFNPNAPLNLSPNNTGIQQLPPAQKAFIWYPYWNGEDFPLMGFGGRTAMVAPFYDSSQYKNSAIALPDYFDNKVMTYEWMRGKFYLVELDEKGDFYEMEPVFEQFEFANPIDTEWGPDGSLYVLEYGKSWTTENLDARIVKIGYNAGNRAPIAAITTDKASGALPLSVKFSGGASIDYDKDDVLSYKWNFPDGTTQTGKDVSFTFDKAGVYAVSLEVTDAEGGKSTTKTEVLAGNEAPQITWNVENRTFYWDNQPITYHVSVTDREDGTINPEMVTINKTFVPMGFDLTSVGQGHQQQKEIISAVQLIEKSDCSSCHKTQEVAVGPSFMQVSERYKSGKNMQQYLARKIQTGSRGVWGQQQMPAHPGLTASEAGRIADYILSLAKKEKPIPLSGQLPMTEHKAQNAPNGTYHFRAAYADKGAQGVRSLITGADLILRPATIQAEHYTRMDPNIRLEERAGKYWLGNIRHQAFLMYDKLDLTNIRKLVLGLVGKATGTIELRVGGINGTVVGSTDLATSEEIPIQASGVQEVWLVYRNPADGNTQIALDWIRFERGGNP